MEKKQYKSDNYNRLKRSKLPSINFYSPYFDNILWQCSSEPMNLWLFMMAVYNYIHFGQDPEDSNIDFYHTKDFHIMFDKVMHNINMTADWFFKKKREEERRNKLTISKDDIDSVFRTEGNFVGIIDDKQK